MKVSIEDKASLTSIFKNFVMVTIGAFIFAYGLETFLVPNDIIDGGVVGVSLILNEMTSLSFSLFLIVLNIPFLIIGYKRIGKQFAIQSLYGIVLAAFLTKYMHHISPTTDDPLLAAVFGGILIGIGVGIVLRNNSAIDGTEILATLISSKSPFSVGQIVMFINLFIITTAGFVFGVDSAFYSLIAYYIAFKMIDIVVEGMNDSKSVLIITDSYEEIGQMIMERLERTVTFIDAEGAYSGRKKKIIFCVITRLEEYKLKKIVKYCDANAFITTSALSEVRGGNFESKH